MSIYNCHKQQPQPWMSYISPAKICFPGECCPALVTGDRCDVVETIVEYGYLYNWFAVSDARNICAVGWHIPTHLEYRALYNFTGEISAWSWLTVGGNFKVIGTDYWLAPNSGAINLYGFNGRGSGYRTEGGAFVELNTLLRAYCSTESAGVPYISDIAQHDNTNIGIAFGHVNFGLALRPMKDTTLLVDGEVGSYTGNNGRVYATICINGVEYLSENLCETEYRDGSPIPVVTDTGAWVALVTGARCSYNNIESNALDETISCGQSLLPFQVISNGDFVRMEYSLYDENTWHEITLPITTVMTDGFYIHSYNGEPLDTELPCGVYKFRLVAGETWWFEPIMIQDFEIVESEFSIVDDMMLPLKFSEQIIDTTPLIAPCDTILPFMFRTENVTSGVITVTMVDTDGAETALTITVSTAVIDGMTYYWHRGECLSPFLTCGRYYLKIVDGANTYYSVPFVPECEIEDIPDGYRALRDANGCVMRDADGDILYEWCQLPVNIAYGYLYNWPAATDARGIAPAGWHVPTEAEWVILVANIGALNAGGKLKETGLVHWNSPNTGATNEFGFFAYGGGGRSDVDGSFSLIGEACSFWSSTQHLPGRGSCVVMSYDDADLFYDGAALDMAQGASVRCLRDTIDGWMSGDQVIDYDGNVYDTVQIGTQVWMVQNLAVSHYNDGSVIPEVTDDVTWAAVVTGARCSYDNDESNAFII